MKNRDYYSIALDYASKVISGEIPACKLTIAACNRQVSDLAKWNKKDSLYFFDKSKADKVCKFIELLPHVKGSKAGKEIFLEPWQVFILTTAFGWVKKDGNRRFRRVYIEVPRGNGKSCLSSGVCLYALSADGEGGAEIYSVATTRDQAKIVFGDSQTMVRKSQGLRTNFGVEVNAHNINILRTGSKFEALSSEGSTLDGLNTHLACIDELHAHKTRDVYDVVETSIGKRDQSMLWVITTAGSNRSGICYEVRGFVAKILNEDAQDDSQFGIIYGLDDGDDWTTEQALVKANPNWGISVMPEVIRSLQSKAMQLPSAVNNFLTKHLNEWVNADSAWMDMRAWSACSDISIDIEDMVGKDCYIGIDLASKIDIAAVSILFKGEDGIYTLFNKFYLPEETIENSQNSQYSGWERSGLLTATSGNVIDFSYIENDLIRMCSLFNVLEVAYDPFQATQFATRMMGEGVRMVEMRQTVLNFSEPLKNLEALVLDKKIRHTGCPVLAWMVSNVVCHTDAKDNVYPKKERPENKIDGVISTIMALGRAITAPIVEKSFWEAA